MFFLWNNIFCEKPSAILVEGFFSRSELNGLGLRRSERKGKTI